MINFPKIVFSFQWSIDERNNIFAWKSPPLLNIIDPIYNCKIALKCDIWS